ncbi:uncharacterized protein LOC129726462 [Wyeomyia smithii]|uniref:uncharacterized protein LOC129726462 n=1 Tax=Wyeomyia smithii TaxID=174621 RepID=UPI002467C654|nr:uncharacterized protein LOC129726462 [Wyeomyia smithii]
MNAIVKSAVYLTAIGGIGYVLLEVTKPSKARLDELKRQHQRGSAEAAEAQSKKALFMQKIKEAAESKEPIYLKKKED